MDRFLTRRYYKSCFFSHETGGMWQGILKMKIVTGCGFSGIATFNVQPEPALFCYTILR
ncbi:hypothetical protein [Chryseolinea lacunae]|uniref:Uncharacterized protein n=1 Tax=Chryseolinea lacunae TaxID=2801331 RepID=A0ABS1KMP3_9BACT|nr:hypothetical protein [Chryseolinea lacunae]MBL0740517.1 hypothetical protein [Chryseolinea lacunae]